MAQIGGAPGHDHVQIGDVSAPPFVRLPDPGRLFTVRSERFRQLAPAHELRPYLELMAGLADVQHAIQADLPEPATPSEAELARSREFEMPALDRSRFPEQDACRETLRRFLEGAAALDMPPAARRALDQVVEAGEDIQLAMARAVLDDAIPFDEVAEHVLVAAALQVHAARLASRLDGASLVAVGEGACPACGGAPSSSVVVGWLGAHGARFCSCSLCGTLWNSVRIRCTACGSTKGITYPELEGGPGTVRAEACAECRTYLKIFYQVKDGSLDPVADDVASTALDLLMSETGSRRSGANPFLLGY